MKQNTLLLGRTRSQSKARQQIEQPWCITTRDIALAGTVGWASPLVTLIRDAKPDGITPIPLKSMPHMETCSPVT